MTPHIAVNYEVILLLWPCHANGTSPCFILSVNPENQVLIRTKLDHLLLHSNYETDTEIICMAGAYSSDATHANVSRGRSM